MENLHHLVTAMLTPKRGRIIDGEQENGGGELRPRVEILLIAIDCSKSIVKADDPRKLIILKLLIA
ncbi:MAG TPA: hypothetical protein VN089_13675 [Duganella sp.]|nr:hypothetical protein [Duganella sp.]